MGDERERGEMILWMVGQEQEIIVIPR